MNTIFHGTWIPTLNSFFLWGEQPELPTRKSRKRKHIPHPFQCSTDILFRWLKDMLENSSTTVNLERVADHTQTLWLPSIEKSPVPSPEILATGAFVVPEGEVVLSDWQVTGLLFPINTCLDMLLAMTPQYEQACGADIRAWRMAALMAMELVASQSVMPALVRDGFVLRAQWQPRPTPTMMQNIATLSHAMPPLCRAAIDKPAAAPSSRVLLNSFLTAAVDATIRELPFLPEFTTTTPGGKWLSALLEEETKVNLKGPAADALYKSWQSWAGQTQVAGDDVFRITFRLESPQKPTDAWKLSYLLQATDDPSLIVSAAMVWREKGNSFTYVDRRFEQPQERLLRGLGHAAKLFPPLESGLRQSAPDHTMLSLSDAFTFLKEAAPIMEQTGYGLLVPNWWKGSGARLSARAKASSGPSKTNEQAALSLDKLIDFQWELALGDQPMSLEEFEKLVNLKVPLVQVRGEWVALDPDHLDQMLAFLQKADGQMSFAEALRMGMSNMSQEVPPGIDFGGIEVDGWLKEALDGLENTQKIDPIPVPQSLQATLRPYQERGFSWLRFMQQFYLGACLADDMGLGKTIQTITLLLSQYEQDNGDAPSKHILSLLVCPTSVIGNWLREIQRFAPSLRVLVQQGGDRRQGKSFLDVLDSYDVVLTSYPLLARDRKMLTQVDWDIVVLDEAQNIKNPATQQAQAARALNAATRIALTGTPVENRLSELWSIMSFLNPGYLGNLDYFRRTFAKPIERTGDAKATEQLKRLTTPFILRRLKTDKSIIQDLPEKLEMNVYCGLSQEQATLYQAAVKEGFGAVKEAEQEGDQMKRRGEVLAMLTKLKQICNHPVQFLKDDTALADRSGKLDRLTEMLEEIYEVGDRALIFTQFAEMGTLLQGYLSERFYEQVLFLHGGVKPNKRDEMVRKFQAPRGPSVFILSLKAGGTGLNLTNANHVFHFDRWWNPAVENQATDRAFRIGQTRNVQVHKFICQGTLEDHINNLIEQKRSLAESIVGAGEGWLTEMTTDQLRDIVMLR